MEEVPETGDEDDEEARELTAALHRDYDEVPINKVPAGPRPERGPNYVGHIVLKPDARPYVPKSI